MAKTALIVDDSPLARHVLSRLLADYGLVAETTQSAEMALEYLKRRRPDVVFMDHLMPGMDGFAALEAIKTNPATATIPVMMYTSQEGELYVSQARALGAFGVLPKELKPIEVARVLSALHLVSGAEHTTVSSTSMDTESAGAADAKAATDSNGKSDSADTTDLHDRVDISESADLAKLPDSDDLAELADSVDLADSLDSAENMHVREMLAELFDQQRLVLREEIRDTYRQAIAATQPPEIVELPAPPRSSSARLVAVGTMLLALVFLMLYLNTNRLLEEANERTSELSATAAVLGGLNAATSEAPESTIVPSAETFAAIERAMNFGGYYGFGDIPLDDARADLFGELIANLNTLGFSGDVALEVHVGSFCMNYTDAGINVLPAAGTLVSGCDQIGWLGAEAEVLGRRQSLAFANTIGTATEGTDIVVRIESRGSSEPEFAYPPIDEYLSADDWNRVAAQNSRVRIRLTPTVR